MNAREVQEKTDSVEKTLSFSFPKSKRLLKPYEFRRVTKQGSTVSGQFLTIHAQKERRTSKLGLTVSRKYGDAVERNRFKRLVREAFRLSQHVLPPNLHLNIRPTGKFRPEMTLDTIQLELSELLIKK